ncbi:MAG: hypothetical protein QOE77_3914 [Blastocatellia bacterium]|jgi:uncharacterized protein (DUF1800 family)|nr:hypothetical protein [Blastocatellia bacterium]
MKSQNSVLTYGRNQTASGAIALIATLALLSSTLSLGVSAQQKTSAEKTQLKDEQRILHVLNRLGFGARPGDVERVKAIGIEKYIAQQLEPTKLDDAVAEAKVQNLESLRMTTAALYEKYPQPGQLLRQLQRTGDLPSNVAEARDNRTKGGANATPAAPATSGVAMPGDDMAKAQDDKVIAALSANGDPANPNNDAYRKVIRDYYAKNNLRQPALLVGELHASRILRAVYSERQLQEVMVDFWTNHFNVFAGKGADRWLLPAYDRDTIRPHTLGKFYDLLQATAESPAMLFYLDNFQSVSPNSRPGPLAGPGQDLRRRQLNRPGAGTNVPQIRTLPNGPIVMSNNPQQQRPQQPRAQGINENYARELMELHTLGVNGGYTQKDVQEVARCFTGWTIFAPRGGAAAAQAITGMNGRRAEMLRENAGTFYFAANRHDDGEKIVLGQKIPAGGGIKDGLRVLDILAHHPATAKFIATKLARRFVMDNPSPALVDRVAAAFTKSDGDIRETLKAIFFSPEFSSPDAYRAKVKRPFELAISAVRTLGADTNGGPGFHQWIARMGQPLYGFQTPNGYSDVAEDWVNTGALLERLNFGLSLASNRIPGTRVNLERFAGSTDPKSIDKAQVMDRFLSLIVQGEISPRTKEMLLKQMNEQITLPPPTPVAAGGMGQRGDDMNPSMAPQFGGRNALPAQMDSPDGPQPRRQQQLARANAAEINNPIVKIVGLILGSPEFQRQ